jgi:hypothetical protein
LIAQQQDTQQQQQQHEHEELGCRQQWFGIAGCPQVRRAAGRLEGCIMLIAQQQGQEQKGCKQQWFWHRWLCCALVEDSCGKVLDVEWLQLAAADIMWYLIKYLRSPS